MQKIILILLALGPFTELSAQNQTRLSIAPMHVQQIEELLLPKRQSNTGISASGSYQKQSASSLQQWILATGYAHPKTSFEPAATSTWVSFMLEYQNLRTIQKSSPYKLQLGGFVRSSYQIGFYPLWDDSHGYWSTFLGIGPGARLSRQIGERTEAYLSIDLPLLGLSARPKPYWDYKIENTAPGNVLRLLHQDLTPVSLNRLLQPKLEAGIQLKWSELWRQGFFYKLEFMRLNMHHSLPYRHLIQGIGIQFLF